MIRLRRLILFPVALLGLAVAAAGCRHGDRSERILIHVDGRVSKLDLNEAQKVKYAEIRAKVATEMKQSFGTREQVKETLRTEFRKEAPDVRAASAAMEQVIQARGQSFARLPGYFADFYETLNAEQKARVLKKIRSKLDL